MVLIHKNSLYFCSEFVCIGKSVLHYLFCISSNRLNIAAGVSLKMCEAVMRP